MSEQSIELLSRIRRRLAGTARRMTMADLLFGFAVSLGITSTVWIVSVAVEAGFWLGTTSRTLLFWGVLTLLIALFSFFVLLPLLRLSGVLSGPSPESVARRVGSHFPEIGDRLTNLLDLSEGRRSDAPDALIDGAVRMLGRQVETVEFEKVETYMRARRAVRFAAIPLASLLLFVAAAPSLFVDASKRLFSPGTTFHAPAPFLLVVEPGNQEVPRGTATEIRVRAEGQEQPRTVTLSYNNVDEEHVEEIRLSADSSGVFRHQFANVRHSFRYRAAAAPVTSEWYRTEVTEHPLVRGMQVTLDFPSYSGIPPQRLDPNIGDVSGLPGSRVNLELEIGGSAVDEAIVLFNDGSTHPLTLANNRASGSFQLTREGNYQIVLKNRQGTQNRDPIAYTMSLISDATPSIVLIHPEPDAVLGEDLQSLLVARMSDDYGFRDLRLHYRLAESRFGDPSDEFETAPIPLGAPAQLDQEVRFDWEVAKSTDLDPVPGDVIEYFLEVRDNDSYSGYKSANTSVHRLRLPSLAEKYEQIETKQDEVEESIEEMVQNADRIREQFHELRDELRRKQDADWEDKRQLDQIEERQRQLEEQTTQLSEQMEFMNRSMEQNNLLSAETMEMYQEMQKVVEEINSPELMDALRQLQESIQKLNFQQMQQAVEDFEFSEEQYQQRLERALELFKNLRTQQALEEAARRAEEIARQQERLAERTREFLEEQERENRADDQSGETDDATESEQDQENGDIREEGEKREDQERSEGENTEQDPQSNDRTSEQNEDAEGQESESEDGNSPEGENQQSSNPEKLAVEQERSKEEMEQLEALLEQIREQMDELQKGPKEEMQRLNESVQQQQIPQQMQENADQIRQQQMQEAQQGQQQMQQQLQQLQSQLSEMQTGMQGRQMEMNVAGLRRALSDVLTLSQKQEELRRSLRNTASEAPSLREDARGQMELSEGLTTVIDTLHNLAKNIPQMSREVQRQSGEAMRQMSRATDAMTERAVDQAAGYQKASMMHLNELALMLSDVMNQMMNASGSGSGSSSMQQMIQQMQQMAGQQQQLNQQIQQFLNDIQGNRLSVDMQERLQQMSSQQQAIKQQLDQLRRNPEARGKLLGDLEKIGTQMEETITELERRQVKPEMIERQQQILQRLLDAQRSIHQRGEEEKREGREGSDIKRESPGDLPPEEAADKLRRDLIKALESGYAPDYEDLIKRYFELLQNQTLQQD